MRYEIVTGSSEISGGMGRRTPWWAVVAYSGDECLGADAHWVSAQLAEAAKTAYENGTLEHGNPGNTQRVAHLAYGRS